MRAAGFLFFLVACAIGCSRTTLSLPDEPSMVEGEAGVCGGSGEWLVSAPTMLAPPTRLDGSQMHLDVAVAGDRTAVVHDVFNNGRPFHAFRAITASDRLGDRLSLVTGQVRSAMVVPTETHFRTMWTDADGHFWIRDIGGDDASLNAPIDVGRLAEPGPVVESAVYLQAAWSDAIVFFVGPRTSPPRYLALSPAGEVSVPLSDAPTRQQWNFGPTLRRERLFVPLVDVVAGPEDDVLRLVTFDEANKRIESTREIHRARDLASSSIISGPGGSILLAAVEYGVRTVLFTIRGDAVERSTLPTTGWPNAASLVAGNDGTAALITHNGPRNELSRELYFAPMRLSDGSVGTRLRINAATPGRCLEASRIVASGCGFVAVWREGCAPGDISRTLYSARITPR